MLHSDHHSRCRAARWSARSTNSIGRCEAHTPIAHSVTMESRNVSGRESGGWLAAGFIGKVVRQQWDVHSRPTAEHADFIYMDTVIALRLQRRVIARKLEQSRGSISGAHVCSGGRIRPGPL